MNLTEDIKAGIATSRVLIMTIRSIQSSMAVMLQIVSEEDLKTIISGLTESCIKAHKKADKDAREDLDKQLKERLEECLKVHQKKVEK